MGVVLLDTTTIVGFLDADDVLHAAADAKLRELATSEILIASVVTYAETLTGAALGHHDADIVRSFFRDLIAEIVAVDVQIAERAAELRVARTSVRMPDALVLASGEVRQVDVIVTGDDEWPKVPGLSSEIEVLKAVSKRRRKR